MKPVRDSKVPTKLVRQGNVASVSRRRTTLTNVVTLEANSSGGAVSDSNVLTEPVQQSVAIVGWKRKVVSDSNVLTEPVQQSVAIVGRKRKVVSDSKILTELVQQGIVASVGRKRKVVSDSNVLTEPVQQGIVASVGQKRKVVSDSNVLTELVQQGIVASVGWKRKAKPVTADYGGSIAEVKTRKRLGIVQTDDVISNVKTGRVSKKINKPTLVPSAVIPSISDDDSQFSQSLDEEEKAYREQLAASQKSSSGKGKGKGNPVGY